MFKLSLLVLPLIFWSHAAFGANQYQGRTELHWESRDGCPTEAEVVKLVEESLGQRLDAPREQSLRLIAKVTRNDAGEYEVFLTTEGRSGTGQRHLSNANCVRLAEAAALVMAIAIDPNRIERHHPTEPGHSNAGATTAVAPSSTSTNTLDHQPPLQLTKAASFVGSIALGGRVIPAPTESFWSVSVQSLVGSGTLPVVDLGLQAAAVHSPAPGLEIHAGVGALLPENVSVPASDRAQIAIHADFADLGVCGVGVKGTWQPRLCAGAQVGLMLARGQGFEDAHSTNAAYATLVTEAGYGYRVSRSFRLSGMVMAGLGVLRPEFGVIRNGDPIAVYRPALGIVRFALGLSWDLP